MNEYCYVFGLLVVKNGKDKKNRYIFMYGSRLFKLMGIEN